MERAERNGHAGELDDEPLDAKALHHRGEPLHAQPAYGQPRLAPALQAHELEDRRPGMVPLRGSDIGDRRAGAPPMGSERYPPAYGDAQAPYMRNGPPPQHGMAPRRLTEGPMMDNGHPPGGAAAAVMAAGGDTLDRLSAALADEYYASGLRPNVFELVRRCYPGQCCFWNGAEDSCRYGASCNNYGSHILGQSTRAFHVSRLPRCLPELLSVWLARL